MKCSNCGKEVNNTAKFCEECGTTLLLKPDKNEIAAEQTEQPKSKADVKRKIIIIICAVVAGLVLSYFLLIGLSSRGSGNSDSAEQVGKQYAESSVIKWQYLDYNYKDDYNLSTPYIENGYIYIPIEVQINAPLTVQYRGFGTASVNDTFDKTVPMKYEYEESTVTKGVFQNLMLRVPISDLDVQKPTTLYVDLAVFINGNYGSIKLEFDMSW